MGKFNLMSLSLHKVCGSIKMKIEFEKQISNLNAITGKNLDSSEEIKSIVNWFRGEFIKRPEKYAGDHVPLKYIRDNIAKGLTIELSIQKTYDKLNSEFKIIDIRRTMGI